MKTEFKKKQTKNKKGQQRVTETIISLTINKFTLLEASLQRIFIEF